MSEQKRFEDILRRIRRGMATTQDADALKAMMHEAWERNKREQRG